MITLKHKPGRYAIIGGNRFEFSRLRFGDRFCLHEKTGEFIGRYQAATDAELNDDSELTIKVRDITNEIL